MNNMNNNKTILENANEVEVAKYQGAISLRDKQLIEMVETALAVADGDINLYQAGKAMDCDSNVAHNRLIRSIYQAYARGLIDIVYNEERYGNTIR